MEGNENIKNNLVITRKTLEKIRDYSRFVCEKRNIECYGFLLNPKDKKDHIVYNAILACDQIVSGVSAEIAAEGAFKSKAEIENLGYDAIGCWHSHHEIGAWHSSIDDSNLEKLVSLIAGNRELILEEREPLKRNFERNKLLIRENGTEIEIKSPTPISEYLTERKIINPEINYMHTKDNRFFLNINGKTISLALGEHELSFKHPKPEKLRSVGYAYSLVVSMKKVYAEIALKDICSVCEHSHIEKKPVRVEIISPDSDISFTEEELKEEIKKKVRKPKILGILPG